VDSTGNAAGNYVTRKALRDTVAVRDAEIALKANSDSPIFTTTATLPASLTIGSSSVTGTEAYSSENYGATVIPASGVSRDFTNPVPYTVTAEDGITIQEWVVTVTQDAAPPVDSTGRIVKFGGKIMKR